MTTYQGVCGRLRLTAGPRRAAVTTFAVGLLLVLFGAVLTGSAHAHSSGKLLAYRVLSAHVGGHVRAHNGAALYVPPDVLKRDSLVTITRMRSGAYDMHINGEWAGQVRVTLPRRKHSTVVLHRLGQTWVREGDRGRRTVWVTQLSLFSWATDKVKAALCFKTINAKAVVQCLRSKGVAKVTSSVFVWIVGHVGADTDRACMQRIAGASNEFFVPAIWAALTGACVVKLTDPAYPVPTTPSPTPAPSQPSAPQPGPTSPPSGVPSTPPAGPSPAPSYRAETTGGVAHTWTNPANAGGTEGPPIGANTTVQIACKLTGFKVADGNTWWYRIASSPWNSSFYVSADAFYNNGQTTGPLHGTPFVDPAVPDC